MKGVRWKKRGDENRPVENARSERFVRFRALGPQLLNQSVSWVISIADQVVFSATNFIAALIVARSSSPAEFGLYTLGITIVLFITDTSSSVVSAPQTIYSPQLQGRRLAAYSGSTLVHQFFVAVAASAIVLIALLGLTTFSHAMNGLPLVLCAIAAVVAFPLLREYVRRFWMLTNRVIALLALDVSILCTQSSVLLILAFLHGSNAWTAVLVIGGTCAAAASTALWIDRSRFAIEYPAIWPDFRLNWKMGRWILASAVAWGLSNHAYPWMIAAKHGMSSAGLWAASMGILAIVNIPLAGVINLLTPRVVQAYAVGGARCLRSYVHKTTVIFVGLAWLLCIIPFFFGETLAVLIYGPEYSGTSKIIAVLAINVVLAAPWLCAQKGLYALGRTGVDFAINAIPITVLFAAGWKLVSAYGPMGAAIGFALANAFSSIARILAFERISIRTLKYERQTAEEPGELH